MHNSPPPISISQTDSATDLAIAGPSFSLVIPVYNEEEGVAQTLDDLHNVLGAARCQYEIVVVDDGSRDRTAEILKPRSDIRLIQHDRNRGYGAALKTGISRAKYPLVAITDADSTYPSDRLLELVELAEDADMVVGARTGENVTYSTLRKIPKFFLVRFAEWIAKRPIPDLNSGMRVFRKSAVTRFLSVLPDTFSFTTTITLAMLTNNYVVRYQPIDYFHRAGRSKIRPIRDTLLFIQLILRTGVYFAPLRIFLPIAGVFFLGSLASLWVDLFIARDLTESTLILFVTSIQIGIFALLADMIDKRTGRF
ncbi:glycosyltransferase family 2 protein [Synechococcus sp. PCC 7336]|uniref:glycosyltransferase family 2 protein n=1 Tax=Synechococcus sp. PCC 7336 TaxID=195250 RepID=UPI000348AD27|nr:glycosyltransferase family 2 protein [Synechococcus sp. PCC 7336]